MTHHQTLGEFKNKDHSKHKILSWFCWNLNYFSRNRPLSCSQLLGQDSILGFNIEPFARELQRLGGRRHRSSMDSNIPSYFLPRSSRQTGSQVYWFRVKVWYLTTPLLHIIFVCICVSAMMKEQMKPSILLYYYLPCIRYNMLCIS